MAVDEALLLSAEETGVCCLRFYTWSDPTLSLGYFQPHQQRHEHQSSRQCAIVRRSTGGGAILHDRELTYSFTAPVDDRASRDVGEFYDAFHETLVSVLAGHGVSATLHQGASAPSAGEPFLCFERRADGDVTMGGHKVAGSAQRRHKRALLQHGSVLIDRSRFAPELDGINDLADCSLSASDLADNWASVLADRLGLKLAADSLTQREAKVAEDLERTRFADTGWISRR